MDSVINKRKIRVMHTSALFVIVGATIAGIGTVMLFVQLMFMKRRKRAQGSAAEAVGLAAASAADRPGVLTVPVGRIEAGASEDTVKLKRGSASYSGEAPYDSTVKLGR